MQFVFIAKILKFIKENNVVLETLSFQMLVDVLDFHEFLKSKNVESEFIEALGEHTWEFCDKYIKEFIKTLTL